MKSVYEKPFAKKVDFLFRNQVVAQSGDFTGGEGNRDDTNVCQYERGTACNYIQKSLTRHLWDCEVVLP